MGDMIWLASFLIGVVSILGMLAFSVTFFICWAEENFKPILDCAPYPTDDNGEPILETGLPALEQEFVTTMADQMAYDEDQQILEEMNDMLQTVDVLKGPKMDCMEDIDYFHRKLASTLGIPKQFINLLDYVVQEELGREDVPILEAGGPIGDKLIEDCWMRDQLVIRLDDAEDIVGLINDNIKSVKAEVDRTKRQIVIKRIDYC